MLKIFQKYIALVYIKYFIIIFVALETFYVSIDLLTNLKNLPSSANLFLLYIVFNLLSSFNYTLPLSLVFAMIATKFAMIRSNELISMYSVAISKNRLILPIFFVSLILTIIYIALNCTSFVYSYEYKRNIAKYNQIISTSSNLFLKFEGKYVYFEILEPIKQEAFGVKIFSTSKSELKEIISAKKAKFLNNTWELYDVEIIHKPDIEITKNPQLKIVKKDKMIGLQGFKPKIIENVHHGNIVLSIPDSIEAIKFFYFQGINIDKIKANLYTLIFFPLFAPLMLVVLYYYLPASSRFFNLAILSSVFVFITLFVWGFLFILVRFSSNGVIKPEIGIILPIIIMFFVALKLYFKNR